MIGKHLEVRAVVASGNEAESLHLGTDHVGALHVPDATDLAPLHRVVGKLIETDPQVALVDRGGRLRRLHHCRIAVLIELPGPLRANDARRRSDKKKQGDWDESGLRHSDSSWVVSASLFVRIRTGPAHGWTICRPRGPRPYSPPPFLPRTSLIAPVTPPTDFAGRVAIIT